MKKKIPKIILILSFVLYAFVLLYGVYSAFAGFTFFSTVYGVEAFVGAIILALWILCSIPVIPVCLIYQTAYFLKRKCNIEDNTLKIIKKIVLLISFLPYTFVLIYGIYSAFAGFRDIGHTIYGVNAFCEAVVEETKYLCFYPVIPPCLAYQLVCLISLIIKKHTIKNPISKLREIFYL
ncbi:MAG: hypothetical protein K2N27_05955 [Ruminococcus sp.]|nr:hypothetical protein [Ruminococcus sp.]